MESEWTRFVPSMEHIGLRARFRKVVKGVAEEAIGKIIFYPDNRPWEYCVAIDCDCGTILNFANGKCPFYDDKDGERHYMGEEFEVEYYYKLIED